MNTEDSKAPADSKAQGDRGAKPDEMMKAHEWLAHVGQLLDLPGELPRDYVKPILDLTKDVAHNRSRPSTPVTAFLVGVAAGIEASGQTPDQEKLQQAIDQALATAHDAAKD